MRFTASIVAVAAAVVPLAFAQDVTINPVTLTQCADSIVTLTSDLAISYAAIIPANDPCTEDALAEFYDIENGTFDYFVNQPAGTQIQVYAVDSNNNEYWGEIETVGAGDSSCLGGSNSTVTTSSTSVAPTTTSNTYSYAAPTVAPASYSAPSSNFGSDTGSGSNNDGNAPANAADNTSTTASASGASTVSASLTLIVGAVAAVAALL